MAARASVDAMGADGSDRVHVTRTLRLCRSIRAPHFRGHAVERMIGDMNMPLTLARLGYLVVGVAGLVTGWTWWQAGDAGSFLLLLGGGMALAAAVWVTSDGLARGAIASIGIVIGALLVAMPAFLAAAFTATYAGDLPRAVLATPIGVVAAAAWIMWRDSHRPWDRPRLGAQ
jgi:hypothetical protein